MNMKQGRNKILRGIQYSKTLFWGFAKQHQQQRHFFLYPTTTTTQQPPFEDWIESCESLMQSLPAKLFLQKVYIQQQQRSLLNQNNNNNTAKLFKSPAMLLLRRRGQRVRFRLGQTRLSPCQQAHFYVSNSFIISIVVTAATTCCQLFCGAATGTPKGNPGHSETTESNLQIGQQ